MTTSEIKKFLLWCLGINYAVLLVWFAFFSLAHDSIHQLHARWFSIPVETFDALHYLGMSIYKIGILLLNLVPLIALHLLKR